MKTQEKQTVTPGSFLIEMEVHTEWFDKESETWKPTHPEGKWQPWPTGSEMRLVVTSTGQVLDKASEIQ